MRLYLGGIACSAVLGLLIPGVARGEFYFARAGGQLVVTNDAPPLLEGRFEEFVFIQEGVFVFQTVVVHFTITDRTPEPDEFLATCVFTDEAGDTMSGSIAGVRFIGDDGNWSGGGEWLVSGADSTGAYTGISGTGTFAFGTLIEEDSAFSTFEGTFVPGPGSGILMSGAGMLLARRRRR